MPNINTPGEHNTVDTGGIIRPHTFEKPVDRKYAGFWRRLFGLIFDYLVVYAAVLMVSKLMLSFGIINEPIWWFIISAPVITFMLIGYSGYFYSRYSETPGEIALGFMVVDEKTKQNMSARQAWLHAFLRIVSIWIAGVGFLVAIFSPQKKTLHDRIAQTVPVRLRKEEFNPQRKKYRWFVIFILILIIPMEYTLVPARSNSMYLPFSKTSQVEVDLPQEEPVPMESAEEIYALRSGGVVSIWGANSFGSGVILTEDGIGVTNFHVLDNLASTIVQDTTGASFIITEILAADPDRDLIIFSIQGEGHDYIPLGDSSLVDIGESVYTLGNPEGLENTIASGEISGKRVMNEMLMFQTTAPISPGSSGGALLDVAGHLIGITTMQHREGQLLNFAIPSAYVERMLRPGMEVDEDATIKNWIDEDATNVGDDEIESDEPGENGANEAAEDDAVEIDLSKWGETEEE